MSWTLSHLLILPYIAWFVCGIMIYRRVTFPGETPPKDRSVLIVAIPVLTIVEGPGIGLLAPSFARAHGGRALANCRGSPTPCSPGWEQFPTRSTWCTKISAGVSSCNWNAPAWRPTWPFLLPYSLSLVWRQALTWLVERPSMRWLRETLPQPPLVHIELAAR